jgi:acetylornithine deacetylase
LKPSFIADSHPLVIAAHKMGISSYGSPTCSDMALMDFPSLKIGPGILPEATAPMNLFL